MLVQNLLKKVIPLLLVFSSVQADTSFSRLYVFGDSLSDTGNLGSVAGGLPPPFFMNRISNGPVAVDELANRLGLTADASMHFLGPAVGSNYAVAGANAIGFGFEDLNAQILSFRVNQGFVAPSDALYVIFIGGNDVRGARDESGNFKAWLAVRAAAFKVRLAVNALARDGARSFLLVNAPDIGAIPETRQLAESNNNPELMTRARQLSKVYRRALSNLAEDLRDDFDDEVSVREFDLFTFFDELLANAGDLGFINTTNGCFDSDTFSFHPECEFGKNFNQFVFFDQIHPTAAVHELAGEAMFEALQADVGP